MFIRHKGKTKIQWLPVTTSTAIAKGALVAWSSGLLIAATSTSEPVLIAGVLAKTIAATDADYATARLVPIEVPVEINTEWLADVTSGLVIADRGLYQDLTDSLVVNRGASSLDVVQCIKVLSTTKGVFHLNIGYSGHGKEGAA